MNKDWIKPLYVVAGVYDAILGLSFLVATGAIFRYFSVEPPNHMAYIHFPALLLLIFAAMFFRISTNPIKYREMMVYGIGLKVAYSGTAFWHQLSGGIPIMWKPWAWADLLFLILFVIAWKKTGTMQQ